MALISLRNLKLSFGVAPLLDDVSLQVERGERICLLGRNGAGKSTLLKVVAGEVKVDEGRVERAQGLRVASLSQQVPTSLGGSVLEVVQGGCDSTSLAQHDAPEAESRYRAEKAISKLSLEPEARIETLSAGLKRRVALARALVAEPDLLLLDEPTNHLDIDSIRWLEDFLVRLDTTLLFVTHDRALLRKLATRIVEIDRGVMYDFPGNYADYLRRRDQAMAAEVRHEAEFDKKLAKEEIWLRQGIKARRTRNEGRVRALETMRKARSSRRERTGMVRMSVQEAKGSGKLVVETKGVEVAFDDKVVLRDLSTIILRGDKVGIIGPNNCGKTTLIRTLLGELEARSGEVRLGARVEVAYFDQLRAQLDDEATVQHNIAEGRDTVVIDGKPKHVLSYLEQFLFAPERARGPVKVLSGGERNRLLLARLFLKPSNLLVLDEPTNDLDVETLELLEERLIHYAGTVLVVSHDRAFLNNVVTSTLAYQGEGRFGDYAGGYDDWLLQRASDQGVGGGRSAGSSAAASGKRKVKTSGPRRLSFKEGKELEKLPGQIEALEAEQGEIHEKMSDPSFYQEDRDVATQVRERLAAIETELEKAYARWQELEEIGSESG